MVSDNIKRAAAAIEAELKHARQGKVHYEQQVTSLQAALNQLNGLGAHALVASLKGMRGRKPKAAVAGAKVPKVRRGRKAAGDLPFTGGDFWVSLVSATPLAGKDVLAAAIKKLGIKPDSIQIKKLTNRMAFACNSLVKAGTIKNSGKGRERRFFKT